MFPSKKYLSKFLIDVKAGEALSLLESVAANVRGRARWGDPATSPTRCVCSVAHWRVEGREIHLIETLGALLKQSPATSIALITNDHVAITDVLASAGLDVEPFDGYAGVTDFLLNTTNRIACVQWWDLSHEHPFHLTWAHKRVFREIVVDRDAFSHGLSHLIYIEDDLGLAPGALDYWCTMRTVLVPYGLIPAFTRCEGPDSDLRLTSPERPFYVEELPGFDMPGNSNQKIVNMSCPYQGFYVLDAPLARYHFTCSSFRGLNRSMASRGIGGRWGVRERAAAGAVFDQVPDGYLSRNVLLLEPGEAGYYAPVQQALVRHLPANYYANPDSKNAKIPLGSAFII